MVLTWQHQQQDKRLLCLFFLTEPCEACVSASHEQRQGQWNKCHIPLMYETSSYFTVLEHVQNLHQGCRESMLTQMFLVQDVVVHGEIDITYSVFCIFWAFLLLNAANRKHEQRLQIHFLKINSCINHFVVAALNWSQHKNDPTCLKMVYFIIIMQEVILINNRNEHESRDDGYFDRFW